jgi:hypothetical protein
MASLRPLQPRPIAKEHIIQRMHRLRDGTFENFRVQGPIRRGRIDTAPMRMYSPPMDLLTLKTPKQNVEI